MPFENAKCRTDDQLNEAAKVNTIDITVGYNGFPMGVEDTAERLGNSEIKLELIVHAEQNALIAAGSRAQGATIFVWGKPVCARCAGSIIQAGVKRVVSIDPNSIDAESKWYKTGKFAIQMFNEAGIDVKFYTQTRPRKNRRNN